MKKFYNTPEWELICINKYDVISTSDGNDIDAGNEGEEVTLPDVDF